jgi:20S proteasome subunit beta 6
MAPFRSSAVTAPPTAAPPLLHHSEGPVYNAAAIDHGVTQAPYERRFSPYDFNGGTTVAISGPDYAVVAADTRLSSGYEILSRNVSKLHPLTPLCVLGSAGCKTDVDQLRSVLDIQMKVTCNTKILCSGIEKMFRTLSNNYCIYFPQ